jgi:hypothetical protein
MKRPNRSQARDLYVSPWFTKARAHVESQAARWFILSAEYGLVEPTAEIDPYERTLNRMTLAERRDWSQRTFDQLLPRLEGVACVVVLAGMRYREFLVPRLVALGKKVEIPLEGLTIGRQLRWFVNRGQAER